MLGLLERSSEILKGILHCYTHAFSRVELRHLPASSAPKLIMFSGLYVTRYIFFLLYRFCTSLLCKTAKKWGKVLLEMW